jgi:hypothetical protein
MALTLDATVGGVNANSYVSLADANSIMEARYHTSSVWSGLTDPQKTQLLVSATLLIDSLAWAGSKVAQTQALRWPRAGAYDCDSFAIAEDVIPQALKIAVCEMAIQYMNSDKFADSGTEGFKSIGLGSISLSIEPSDRPNMVPLFIKQMLRCFIGGAVGSGPFSVPVNRV